MGRKIAVPPKFQQRQIRLVGTQTDVTYRLRLHLLHSAQHLQSYLQRSLLKKLSAKVSYLLK